MMSDLTFFWDLFKGAAALWLALYIFTRGGLHNQPWMAAAALSIWSLSPFSIAIARTVSPDEALFWLRIITAVWPMTIGFFFGVALSLAKELSPSVWKTPLDWVSQAILLFGLLLGALSGLTNLIFNFQSATGEINNFLPSNFNQFGSLHSIYLVYTTATPILLVIILLWSNQQVKASDKRVDTGLQLLVMASVLWLAGLIIRNVLYLDSIVGNGRTALIITSDLLFAATVTLLGWSVAKHNAIVQQKIIFKDFIFSGLGLTVIMAAYAWLPWLLGQTIFTFDTVTAKILTLFLTGVAVLTHMLIETTRLRVRNLLPPEPSAAMENEVSHLLRSSRGGISVIESIKTLDKIRQNTAVREQINKQLIRNLHHPDENFDIDALSLLDLSIVRNRIPKEATNRQKMSQLIYLFQEAITFINDEMLLSNRRKDDIIKVLDLRIKEGLERADITLRLHMHPRKYDRLFAEGLALLADACIEMENKALMRLGGQGG
ncbi:MAG: hypothetical protein AAF490_24780 [Chloroflexota bacterium]